MKEHTTPHTHTHDIHEAGIETRETKSLKVEFADNFLHEEPLS
jgi:hypothetical protein